MAGHEIVAVMRFFPTRLNIGKSAARVYVMSFYPHIPVSMVAIMSGYPHVVFVASRGTNDLDFCDWRRHPDVKAGSCF